MLIEPALGEGSPEGILDTGPGHRLGGGCHIETTTARRGKEPGGLAVGCPIGAESRQGALRQRYLAVFGACAVGHVDQHACTVNSWDLQVGALVQA